jgi:hypothetical protein
MKKVTKTEKVQKRGLIPFLETVPTLSNLL